MVHCNVPILHSDGTSTAAKKGGDNLVYSGHKHHKGEKIVAVVDRHANIISNRDRLLFDIYRLFMV